jgi:hypothetical protein
MINATDLDRVLMDHAARVARTDREGWMTATVSSGDAPRRRFATVAKMTRQWVGVALIGIGSRLQGTPTRHTGDSAAAV